MLYSGKGNIKTLHLRRWTCPPANKNLPSHLTVLSLVWWKEVNVILFTQLSFLYLSDNRITVCGYSEFVVIQLGLLFIVVQHCGYSVTVVIQCVYSMTVGGRGHPDCTLFFSALVASMYTLSLTSVEIIQPKKFTLSVPTGTLQESSARKRK